MFFYCFTCEDVFLFLLVGVELVENYGIGAAVIEYKYFKLILMKDCLVKEMQSGVKYRLWSTEDYGLSVTIFIGK